MKNINIIFIIIIIITKLLFLICYFLFIFRFFLKTLILFNILFTFIDLVN